MIHDDDPDMPVASDTLPAFSEIILGENDMLVLMPRHEVEPAMLMHMAAAIPERLQGRVLVLTDCDVTVVRDVRIST